MINYITAGESHGPELTVVLTGIPAGIEIDEEQIRADLARRQNPLGAGGRMAIETDRARITAGVMAGVTTGAPVAMTIANKNHAAWKGREVPAYTAPRPGHADFAAVVKFGYNDIRPSLERSSARETASRVAAGAVARALLAKFGITVAGRIDEIGGVSGDDAIASAIAQAKQEGETLGGVIAITANGVPPGLGSFATWQEKLDARLAGALASMQAIKGVEFGDGFALARMKGTEANARDADANRMGGIEGGVSNGLPIRIRVAMKPIPTTVKGVETVDLATGEPSRTVYERSDFCPVPRAVVVAEAIVCLVLADALCEKLGGDSIAEMLPRFAVLPRTAHLSPEPKVFWK